MAILVDTFISVPKSRITSTPEYNKQRHHMQKKIIVNRAGNCPTNAKRNLRSSLTRAGS